MASLSIIPLLTIISVPHAKKKEKASNIYLDKKKKRSLSSSLASVMQKIYVSNAIISQLYNKSFSWQNLWDAIFGNIPPPLLKIKYKTLNFIFMMTELGLVSFCFMIISVPFPFYDRKQIDNVWSFFNIFLIP